MSEFLLLSLLGGFLAVEATSVGQFMLSRPLVAGTLTGWLLGAPGTGFAVGVLLEIYLLVSLPVGAARYPEGGPATVIGVAVALTGAAGGMAAAGLALGVATGLVWGQLGGMTVTELRRVNGRLVPRGDGRPVTPGAVVGAHLSGIGLDLVRGTLVTGSGIWVGRAALDWLGGRWPLELPETRHLVLLGGFVSLGILLRGFGGPGTRWAAAVAGLGSGLLAGWVL